MKIFNVDWKRLIVLNLLISLRLPLVFSFTYAAIRPIAQIHDRFLSNRRGNIDRVNITSQVCYLRGLLNDLFDPDERRIRIEDAKSNDWIFLWKEETFNTVQKGLPLWLGTVMLSKQDAIGSLGFDFSVVVPIELKGIDEARMRANINYYKLASKRYKIVFQ